jgi:hypothetical protein
MGDVFDITLVAALLCSREGLADVLTAQEAGYSNQGISDSRFLAFAISSDRAVLTFNRRHSSGQRADLNARDPSLLGIAVVISPGMRALSRVIEPGTRCD